jgi:general transcription factor 3C polypeptide 5 (transcription factor C subunit 1)
MTSSETPELTAIEFPAYAKNPATLIKLIGGPEVLINCINNNSTTVALYMRDDLFSRPVHGHIIPTSNLAIKIIKQKNQKTGETRIKYEVLGRISRTVRFRSLADYQVLPDPKNSIVQLRNDLHTWNGKYCDALIISGFNLKI